MSIQEGCTYRWYLQRPPSMDHPLDTITIPLKTGCYLTRNGRVAVVTEVTFIKALGHVWIGQHKAVQCTWVTLTGKALAQPDKNDRLQPRKQWDIVRRADLPIRRDNEGKE